MKYYLINNKIMKGGEMPKTKIGIQAVGEHHYHNWLSSLQPCEISESELDKVKEFILKDNNSRVFSKTIDVTDIISIGNEWSNKKQCFVDAIYFKHPKQVDGEIEAVESQEDLWIEVRNIIINEPSQIRLDICKKQFTIKRNI